ncbi:hypothetical protein EM6_0469 [Asticcacaulis excentricus]|uniref:Uncharacterized protein n=2 Tax=Asticcacaulis excentricus TaxID=78587 RepID=A0A3G9FXR0_9CAUL|nr:hypothetical protein EM6_0469 [Asticcacaulis excentricus]
MFDLYVSIWDEEFNNSGLMAEWLSALGASDVIITHVLHDTMNYDRDGRDTENNFIRNWRVRIFMPDANPSEPPLTGYTLTCINCGHEDTPTLGDTVTIN